MRIFHNIYHFLLFLFVSWTVYNTFIFVCFLLPASKNEFAVLTIIDFWNFYLLGALDFHAFTRDLNDIFINCLDPWSLRKFWPFYLYSFAMTGIALYIWCATQNPFSACFLAIVHCIAGPYLILLFKDYSILFWGAIGS